MVILSASFPPTVAYFCVMFVAAQAALCGVLNEAASACVCRENMPSHFKFKEYCPLVFRNLRERFGIDDQDFQVRTCTHT